MDQRFLRIVLLVLLIGFAVRHGSAQPLSVASARIVGQVRDPSGAVLPAVAVTLTGHDVADRNVLTDGSGRFTFEDVLPQAAYVIRGNLAGFKPYVARDIVVVSGQTLTIDFTLPLSFCGSYEGPAISSLDLDKVLAADVAAFVRIGAAKDKDGECGVIHMREAAVLRVTPLSTAGRGLGRTTLLFDSGFEPGKEYLIVLHAPLDKYPAAIEFQREVVGGRVRGKRADDLRIRAGIRVDEALTRVRDVYERYHRYQPAPYEAMAGLETLHNKTGWVDAAIDLVPEGLLSDRIASWFDIVSVMSQPRNMPRRGDRIRVRETSAVYIREFWAKGEALRDRRPSSQHRSDTNDTGTLVKAGNIYTVADVQIENIPGENYRVLWVRIKAD